VILLHGFPETSAMWQYLMPHIADAGYRVIAPDQRGYSPGARPADAEEYRYAALAADVAGLADACGAPRFHLVGHDWGALAGWVVVDQYPDRVASWCAMSVPHAKAFALAVRDDPEEEPYRQAVALFVTPQVAEQVLFADGMAGLKAQAWTGCSPAQVADYVSVFSDGGAMTGALNWYRASRSHARSLEDPSVPFGPVATPTLLLWGRNDPYIRQRAIDLAAEQMRGEYRVVAMDAGHWLTEEKPDDVAREVLAHIAAHPLA
jgi:pimeloyl-ACP methyl ester carboxylesterase